MRIAVISDVHGNLLALDAVLASAGAVDAVWHLGDVVGYGPEPDAVVERLAAIGAIGVRGNHDAAACGGTEIEWFNPDARSAMEWTRQVVAEPTRAWLSALPERRETGGFTLVHGSGRDPIWEYVTTPAAAAASLVAMDTPHGLNGHTHVPAAYRVVDDRVGRLGPDRGTSESAVALGGGRLLLNPGSVGQPRDGDPRASYLIVDTDAGTASWTRVAYDIVAVDSAMRAAGLPRRLAERLHHGL
ncbi:MAG: metallophosphoesterase family protein [Chloroflexi bacterium]|nr:metallophosphoesterase family protein [Chloroflexota bacterium]